MNARLQVSPEGKRGARPQRRRRLSAEDRRRTILDAALEPFALRGYEGASVDAIARGAGITVGMIYRHFESKEALHRALLEEQWGAMLEHQRAAVFAAAPGRERLHAAYAAYFDWFEAHPLAARLVFREGAGPPAVVDAHEQVLRRATEAIAGYLLGAEAAGSGAEEPGVAIVAEFLKGGTNSVARWWLDHPELQRDLVVDRLVDLTWSGLAALGAEGRLMEALGRRRRK